MAGAVALATALVSAIILIAARIRRGQAQPDRPVESAVSLPVADTPLTEPAAQPIVEAAAPAAEPVQARPIRKRNAPIAAVLTAVAAALMLISAAGFSQVRFLDWSLFFPALIPPLIALASGVIALAGALWWTPWATAWVQPLRSVQMARADRVMLLIGVVLLALGTIFGGRLVESFPKLHANLQFTLLLAGVLLTGWALGGAPRSRPRLPGREGWLIIGLTALALIVRWVEVANTVPGMLDELHLIHGMRELWGDPAVPLLRQASTFLPATILYNYWQVTALAAFGSSLESLRFTSGLVGGLTVPAVYLLARAVFDRRTALAAALLLLAFPPHLHFSRIAHAHVADPLFGVLAIGLFGLGLRTGKRWAWAWGGVALGLTQYFFEGGRLLFPPLVLFWFVFLIVVWGPQRMRPHLRGMATGLLAAVLVAAPMYVTMAAANAPFFTRLADSGAGGGFLDQIRAYETLDPYSQNLLIHRFTDPFLVYTAQPDSTGMWYGSDQPMVLPVLVPLFLLGAAFSILRLRSPGSVVLLAILAASAGNILVLETRWYPRYVVAMPFVPVLMAVGLRYGLPMLWPRDRLPESPRWRAAGAALTPVIACIALIWQFVYYAGPYQRDFAITWRNADGYYDSNDAILRVSRLPNATQYQLVVVSRGGEDVHVARGLESLVIGSPYSLEMLSPDRFTAEYLAQLPRDRAYAFALEPGDTDSYSLLASAFTLEAPQYSTQWLIPADQAYLLYLVEPPAADN